MFVMLFLFILISIITNVLLLYFLDGLWRKFAVDREGAVSVRRTVSVIVSIAIQTSIMAGKLPNRFAAIT